MTWDTIPWNLAEPAYGSTGFDPYLEWTDGPGASDFAQDAEAYIPLLMQLQGSEEDIRAALARLDELFGGQRGLAMATRAEDRGRAFVTYAIRRGEQALRLGELARDRPRALVSLSLGKPLPARSFTERSEPLALPRAWPEKKTDRAVVMGIIDDGIAFAHDRFRHPDGSTRIEALWIQEGSGDPSVPFGRQFDKVAIDALVAGATVGGVLDEDWLYASVNPMRPPVDHRSILQRSSHGAHVMDVAAGFDPAGPVPDWAIVAVQLPTAVTANASGATLRPAAMLAVLYILEKAEALSRARGEALPVVINFSYGITAGPHDGSDPFERFLDFVADTHRIASPEAPLRIVMPAGNSHLARLHARIGFDAGQSTELLWRVQPDDGTPSFVEIWLPAGAGAGRFGLTIAPPGGAPRSPRLGEGSPQLLLWGNGIDARCVALYRAAPSTGRGVFIVAIQPTSRSDAGPGAPLDRVAPSGLWTLTIDSRDGGLEAEAFVQRDDTPYGYPRQGRQSYFDDPLYIVFDDFGALVEEDQDDCIVKRYGSTNALATGEHVVVIGGELRKEERPASYSAGALDPRVPLQRGLDALAPSEDSLVHRGILGAGTRRGTTVALGGTSVAAPRVARWLAEQLSAGAVGSPDGRADVSLLALGQAPAALADQPRQGDGRTRLGPVRPQPRP